MSGLEAVGVLGVIASASRLIDYSFKILDRVRLDYTTGSSRKRVWKAIVGAKEKGMLTSFEKLEKAKINLILCISAGYTQTLHSIENSVGILVENSSFGDLLELPEPAKNFQIHSEKTMCGLDTPTRTPERERESQPSQKPNPNSGVVRDTQPFGPSSQSSRHLSKREPGPVPWRKKDGQNYRGSRSHENATQLNGHFATGINISHAYQD
ncbi:hypothetical protein B7463_g836, partial [Scytalidium lignicola]